MANPEISPREALQRGTDALARLQRPGGDWEGEVVWCPMLAAQYALMCCITDTELSERRRRLLLQQFRSTQLPSGLWGLHEHSEPYLFVTTLVYVAARMLGLERDDPLLAPAREFFRREGGVVAIPSWGKFWLAMLNLYEWEGVNAVLPEAWLLPRHLPLHPSNYYCHTRLIYMGLATIYGEKHRMPWSPRIAELREELFPDGFGRVDWAAARDTLRAEELFTPPSAALRLLYRVSQHVERAHPEPKRREVLAELRRRFRWELQTTAYTCLSPVNGMVGMIGLWIADPDDPDFHEALETFEGWIWEDEQDGTRVTGARSASWDTAFALQALAAADPIARAPEATRRGVAFLETQQIAESFPGWRDNDRDDPKGGWCFAGVWHGWPVSDCTAEAILGLLEAPGARPDTDQLRQGVDFILKRQNVDGGFGSYEAKRPRYLDLEWMNPAEMFGDSMTEQSYLECTASCIAALAAFREHQPEARRRAIKRAVRRGVRFLRGRQKRDGSWEGCWGVHCIYGTMFGIRGLLAGGVSKNDPAVRRACGWLLDYQFADGSWGEHHRGCLTGGYVPRDHGHVIQTAWALCALLEAETPEWEAIDRGTRWLARMQQPDGRWPEQEMVGVFFHTALLHYRLYKQFFSVWALGLAEERRAQRTRQWPREDRPAGHLGSHARNV